MERDCTLQKQLWNSSDKHSKHFLQQGRALCSNHSNQVTARLGTFGADNRTPGWVQTIGHLVGGLLSGTQGSTLSL